MAPARALAKALLTIALASPALALAAPVPEASAFNLLKPACGVAGLVNGAAGKACTVAQHAGTVFKVGKKALAGFPGAPKTAPAGGGSSGSATSGSSSSAASGSRAATLVGLAAIGAWVLGGAKFAMHETAKVLSHTTSPQLKSTWFSSTYWRMAAIASVLTLPFLFAAAVQAMMRSELSLLARAAFGYLPLAMLCVGIAAPVTMLLLAASDQLSAIVSAAAGNAGAEFLTHTATVVGLVAVVSGSPFIAFLIGLFTAAAALTLWLELLLREAAVYVIVLMLPLAFAALVWPARRIWTMRAVELLVALILSKFAIVAVLSLGGAALGTSLGSHGVTATLGGGALVLLAAFAPWALLRLLPLTELASAAAGSARREVQGEAQKLPGKARVHADRVENVLAGMREQADATNGAGPLHDAHERVNGARPEPQPSAQTNEQHASGADQSPASETAEDSPAVPHAADRDTDVDAYPAAEADSERAGHQAQRERIPGMEPRWQQKDFSWPPLELDVDHLPPPDPHPDPLSPEEERSPATPGGAPDQRANDDPDPRPSEQPPLEGRL